jgi:hypothetical protein
MRSPFPSPSLRRLLRALALAGAPAGLALLLVGCAGYRLQGRVVPGPEPAVFVLKAGDRQLDQPGLAGAMVEATLDPSSLSPKRVGTAITDSDGDFELPVDAVGAGVLEYELGLLARNQDSTTLWQTLDLPPGSRRLLIVLRPGPPGKAGPPPDILEETLEMAR